MRKQFTISNMKGLHARAATKLVKVASEYESAVTVWRDGQSANGKSVMSLLILAAPCGTDIEVDVQGPDEADALDAIRRLIEAGFGE